MDTFDIVGQEKTLNIGDIYKLRFVKQISRVISFYQTLIFLNYVFTFQQLWIIGTFDIVDTEWMFCFKQDGCQIN